MDSLHFQTSTAPRLTSLVPHWPPPHTSNPLAPSAAAIAFGAALAQWQGQINRDSTRASEHAREVAAFLRDAEALDANWGSP